MISLILPNTTIIVSLKIKRMFLKAILWFYTIMTIYVQIILRKIYHSFQAKKNQKTKIKKQTTLFKVGGLVVASL